MTLFWGIVFIVLGSAGKFFIGRRQFHRRNAAGIEEHDSYTSALANSVFDKIISIAAVITIILGIMFVAAFLFK